VENRMRLLLGVSGLALSLVAGGSAIARDGERDSAMSPGMSGNSNMMDSSARRMSWSHRFRLTPIEHKRLRAMGLTDKEVFGVANAAHYSGQSVDEVAQMVLRGRSFFQIARELNIPYTVLDHQRPEWNTSEWKHAVDEGWYNMDQGSSRAGSMGRSMTQAASMKCPACGMAMPSTRSAAAPVMVKMDGGTYFCCTGCDMGKKK